MGKGAHEQERPSGSRGRARKRLSFYLGVYEPPQLLRPYLQRIQKGGKAVRSTAAGARRSLGSAWGTLVRKKWPLILIGLVILLGAGLFSGYRIWKSQQPQPLKISSTMNRPKIVAGEETVPLKITFRGPAAHPDLLEEPLPEGARITPEIGGTWMWESEKDLLFTPDGEWRHGTEYQVKLSPDLMGELIETRLNYSFKIPSFHMTVRNREFYVDPQDSSIKRVIFNMHFNYPVDPASLEDRISLRPDIPADSGKLELRDYRYTLTYNDDNTVAYCVSEPVGMPAESVAMKVSIDKGIESALEGPVLDRARQHTTTVPGIEEYVRVEDLSFSLVRREDQRFDQLLILETRGHVTSKAVQENMKVYLLPEDRPELPGLSPVENHNWNSPDEMVPQVLDLAERVSLEPIPQPNEISRVNSYKVQVPEGRQLFVTLAEGTPFHGDYYLGRRYQKILRVDSYPRELKILSDGMILSMTGERKLSLLSRGNSKVSYRIGRVRPDDLNHLLTQSRGSLRNLRFSSRRFGEYNITEQYREEQRVQTSASDEIAYLSFDFSDYLQTLPEKHLRYGFFFFSASSGYESDRRLIVVTDLGFFVKKNADGTRNLFVQSIATGRPVAGAEVKVLGRNGNAVFRGVTRTGGSLSLPSLSQYDREQEPAVFTVSKGNDMSFLPYDSSGHRLDHSSFDIGGVHGSNDENKISSFLFTDRGLYRPGDSVNLGVILKTGDWARNLSGVPIKVEFSSPQGWVVSTQF